MYQNTLRYSKYVHKQWICTISVLPHTFQVLKISTQTMEMYQNVSPHTFQILKMLNKSTPYIWGGGFGAG